MTSLTGLQQLLKNRTMIMATLAVLFLLAVVVVPLTAFEAHVVNVTARIETPCDARSKGYWANHEGCSQGEGSSIWVDEVQALSSAFSGAFASFTGEQICEVLWEPNCGPGNSREGKLCRAQGHALADLLNIITLRLQLDVLLAGADDGNEAFDELGLTSSSTIGEALAAVEAILADPSSTPPDLTNAAYVAERIYTFYGEENPEAPRCIREED